MADETSKNPIDLNMQIGGGFSGTVRGTCWNYLEIEMKVLCYGI